MGTRTPMRRRKCACSLCFEHSFPSILKEDTVTRHGWTAEKKNKPNMPGAGRAAQMRIFLRISALASTGGIRRKTNEDRETRVGRVCDPAYPLSDQVADRQYGAAGTKFQDPGSGRPYRWSSDEDVWYGVPRRRQCALENWLQARFARSNWPRSIGLEHGYSEGCINNCSAALVSRETGYE